MKEDYNNFKSNAYNVLIETVAGWSSLEARRAHNPKVTGSNPVPATTKKSQDIVVLAFFMDIFRSPAGN